MSLVLTKDVSDAFGEFIDVVWEFEQSERDAYERFM